MKQTKKFYARKIHLDSFDNVFVDLCLGNQVSQIELIMEGDHRT